MVSKGEEFILDVRRAARLEQRPIVTSDAELINAEAVGKAIQRAALWLTPKVVQNYQPSEFDAWPEDLQKQLKIAVKKFSDVAGALPPDKAADEQQFRIGVQTFRMLQAATQAVVLWDWKKASSDMINQVEIWSTELNWEPRRGEKKLSETLLGNYSLSTIQFYANSLFVLEPVARFVPGALGSYDLSIQPSFFTSNLYRYFDGKWYAHLDVHPGVSEGRKILWDKDTFCESVKKLRSLCDEQMEMAHGSDRGCS